MIERLQRIATVLHPFRGMIFSFGLVSAGVFLLSLFDNPFLAGETWLMPALVALCWALTMYSLIGLFLHVPARPGAGAGWGERARAALRRGGLWLLGLAFAGLSLALVIFSYQLLRTWFMA